MPMILVKKNPRGKVIRELSSEEETAVKTVCGLKKPATMALHNLANDILREMREYDAWLQCDCIPGDSPAMNFAALKNNTGTLYLSSFNHEHAPECPMYRQLSGNEEETSSGASRHPVSTRINYRNFLRHCCKVSDEAAFCLIQRPYISKTLLTRRISPRGSP